MDRNTYINRLESKLDKFEVMNSTIENFGGKINQISTRIVSVEERMINLTKLIKLLQTNDEIYEQELQKVTEASTHCNRSPCKSKDSMVIINYIIGRIRN